MKLLKPKIHQPKNEMDVLKQQAAEADAQIQSEWLTASAPTPLQTLTPAGEPAKSCAS